MNKQLFPIEALPSPELAKQIVPDEGKRARPEHGCLKEVYEDVVAIQLEEGNQVPEEREVGNAGEEQDRVGGAHRQGLCQERADSAEHEVRDRSGCRDGDAAPAILQPDVGRIDKENGDSEIQGEAAPAHLAAKRLADQGMGQLVAEDQHRNE